MGETTSHYVTHSPLFQRIGRDPESPAKPEFVRRTEGVMGRWKILDVGFDGGRKKGQSEEESSGKEAEVTPASSGRTS